MNPHNLNNPNKQYRNTRLFRTETLAEELGLLLKENQLLAKQVKFEEPDTDKNVVLDDKGSLKRATMLKLVEKLTSESYQYAAAHLKVLFNTYRAYLPPKDLMDLFLLRYSSKNQSIKLRVVVAFKTWVEQHVEDFDGDMISRFRQLVSSISKDPKDYALAPAESIIKLLEKPKNVPRQVPPGRPQFDFWAQKSEDLAVALTTIQFELFNAIKPHEFLKVAWTKDDAQQKAPNIVAAIKHYNKLGEFVRTEILFGETPSLRALRIKHFVDLAIQMQNQHNWNAYFAIIGTMESTPIARLKKTWAEVEKLKYMDIYNKLASIIQPTKNFNKYRDKLKATPLPCAPYLGLILNDIFFLDEGNKDNIGDMVNFLKCFMVSDQIDSFLRFQNKQNKPFDEFTSTVKKYLDEVPTLEHDQDAFEESLKVEPKRNAASSRNSTSSSNSMTAMNPHPDDEDHDTGSELGLQRIVDSHKKMNFVHEPMTLYLKLLGSHTPTKVVLPSSYTAKEALVNFSRKLTGVTPACSLVELPSNIILDDAPLLPYAKSKSQVPLVIFTEPKLVNIGVTLGGTLKHLKEIILDLAAPLFSMLPILQQLFELKDPFSFLYVEDKGVARWLNMNKTLDEQSFKTDKGLLLLYPLKNMLKENAAYKADAELTGELMLKKQDSSFATLKKGSKTKHYIALHDHFLLIFSSSEALVPKKVLSLEHFRMKYNERHHEILLTRTYHGFHHNGKKGSSYILAIPPSNGSSGVLDEDDIKRIKQWFDKMQINCGLIGAHTIFGVPLSNVSARRGPDNPIPVIIEQIIAFLLSMLSKEEEDCSKIFVAPGEATLLDFYRTHFDEGLKVEFTKVHDNLVNTVAQLLISYLMELPSPLLTFHLYDQFLSVGINKQEDYDELKRLVMLLPEPNRVVLCCILEFFSRIIHRAEELGSIFGPIFLRPQLSSASTPTLSSTPSSSFISTPSPLSRSASTPTPTPSLTTPSVHTSTSAHISTPAHTSTPSTPTLSSEPSDAQTPLPGLSLSTSFSSPPHDPAVCVVVTRLIQSYNTILSNSKEGILVRRLLVKTRTKTNTLSAGTNHVEILPNGTVRSAKSDAVEMASDFQKKRQRTLQNVELQKQKIEEMFKGKGSNSSISMRHSNGYSEDEDKEGGSTRLRLSSSAFYPSRRFSKPDNSTTTNTSNNNNNNPSNNSPSTKNNTLPKQNSPRSIYFVKPTLTASQAYTNASQSPEVSNTTEQSREKMLTEFKQLHLDEPTKTTTQPPETEQPQRPPMGSVEAKKLHRRYGMSKLVCAQCKNAILNYDEQQTCSHCGFS